MTVRCHSISNKRFFQIELQHTLNISTMINQCFSMFCFAQIGFQYSFMVLGILQENVFHRNYIFLIWLQYFLTQSHSFSNYLMHLIPEFATQDNLSVPSSWGLDHCHCRRSGNCGFMDEREEGNIASLAEA